MTSDLWQRPSRVQDGWPTLLGWTGEQLRWWWSVRAAAGALPCTSRVLADRGGGAVLCELQSGITLLIMYLQKTNLLLRCIHASPSFQRAHLQRPNRNTLRELSDNKKTGPGPGFLGPNLNRYAALGLVF